MASTNPMNYSNMPMGSHATAGGPHQPVGIPSGVSSLQGSSQFPTPGTHQGMPGMPLSSFQQPAGSGPVDFGALGPTPVMDTEYTQGFLRSQIGKKVQVDFLIGTDNFTDRQGVLVDVGISYIILHETETDDLVLCDIYSIKFVRFYQ